MAKKIFYSDDYGQMIRYTRFRSMKTGRLLKDNTRVRLKSTETVEYRYVKGKRFGKPVYLLTPKKVIKRTAPGAVADYEGSIIDSLRATNVLTQIHNARSALVNIRGVLPNGEDFRHQFTIDHFGEKNQAEQLVNAIYWELASFGLRTNYNINQVKFIHTSPKDARKRDPLLNTVFTITLKG